MGYQEIRIRIPAESREPYLDAIAPLCGSGIYVEDYTNLEEDLRQVRYDYIDDALLKNDSRFVTIHLYPEDTSAERVIREVQAAASSLGISAEIVRNAMPETDWSVSWQDQYPPVKAGRYLIVPPWTEPDTTDLIPVVIGSSGAYGTGQSPNTKLCLEALSSIEIRGSVLDMGAGTGILAIAALLSGADRATGLDIEQDAVTDAAGNAVRNGVETRYTSLMRTKEAETALPDGGYDLVICHITADVILKELPLLKRKMVPGGKILLGGIRTDREADVTSELERMQLEVRSAFRDTEWVTLVCEERKERADGFKNV